MGNFFFPHPGTVEVEGVGKILVERSRRARRLSISVRPFQGPRVAVPYGVSLEKAETIIRKNLGWVRKHLERMKKIEAEYEISARGLVTIEDGRAREILLTRLRELAEENQFVFSGVTIRRQKTRWGSCSEGNRISLNIKLARLPLPLMDYVLFHELVHTRIKNHRRVFWEELEKYVPGAKARARELKKYCL